MLDVYEGDVIEERNGVHYIGQDVFSFHMPPENFDPEFGDLVDSVLNQERAGEKGTV
ncbi:MAG: hypothetical protein LBL44_13070 [Treponema sp.]|nr:hypothetical protein [Treponema sp.]